MTEVAPDVVLPESFKAQLDEAAAPEPVTIKPRTRVVSVAGQSWQIPYEPSVGYLYELSQMEESDDMSQVRATMNATRELLGDVQFKRFRRLPAVNVTELHKAAQRAYGMTEGN